MKQFPDFLLLAAFFMFYRIYDIHAATATPTIAAAIVLIYGWVYFCEIGKMVLITLVLAIVFGGSTLFFHNGKFIKWKVTVIYVLFVGALLISRWATKKSLIQRILGKGLTLPQSVWPELSPAWVVFFILCGLTNIYIAFQLPQNTWVNSKVFGLTALTLILTLLSGVCIYRHMPQEDKS